MFTVTALSYALLQASLSAVALSSDLPEVTLDSATVVGSTTGAVHQFLGIPFAKPPTGNLRFNLPQAVDSYAGTINATTYGPACPQQSGTSPNVTGLPAETLAYFLAASSGTLAADEDCLSINVIKPNSTASSDKLPVVVWIYGGGFETGGAASYPGSVIVERSIAMEQPIIYVSLNYRLSAFGFLPGKEVKEAGVGNLGLHDQRLALRWVQKYISVFGGDSTKVTIWGESAGAISVASQMLINGGDTEGLFRAAFMQSGSPIPTGSIENGQKYYDAIVDATGCAGEDDTLACLRTVPYSDLKAAADQSPNIFDYESLILAFLPRTDGVLITDDVQQLVKRGEIAQIPVVSGDCDDEGTMFSLAQRNVTSNEDFKAYLQTYLFTNMPEDDIDTILDLYPEELSAGSPFDTGDENALTPQFKRIAALLGDFVFQGPRRTFLSAIAEKQDAYAYIHKRFKSIPIMGSFHGSDLILNSLYTGGDMQPYLIRFVATLDPNGDADTDVEWPKWTPETPKMLSFNDGDVPLNVTEDSYREEAIDTLNQLLFQYPI